MEIVSRNSTGKDCRGKELRGIDNKAKGGGPEVEPDPAWGASVLEEGMAEQRPRRIYRETTESSNLDSDSRAPHPCSSHTSSV